MANIARFNPLGDLDKLFQGFFLQPVGLEPQDRLQMKIDLSENDKAFTLRAELPGVKKEDIKVMLDRDQVSISAEVKRETEEKKDEKVVHSERYYGSLYRSLTLPQGIDDKGATAKFSDGVLELTLPKAAVSSGQRLTVQ